MKYLFVRPLFVFFLLLGVSLLGILIVGISRVEALVPPNESLLIEGGFPQNAPATVYVVGNPAVLQQTPISFPTLSPTATLRVEPTVTATLFGFSPSGSPETLQAFIHAPSGLLPEPYVILTAFDSTPGVSVGIRGIENLREFVCTGSPCGLPLTGDSTIRFNAFNASGDVSSEVIARVRVESKDGGFLVIIDSVSQFSIFRDVCSNIWNVKDEAGENWSRFPDSPFQLNTDKILHLLVTRLIVNGMVDAQDCPGGGVATGLDYPTGCGIERATTKMIEWQNQYDFKIWSTALEVGIPPRILKTLIEYESQYWPSNERFYIDEIGLGQINQLGIDVLFRQNPDFYNKVCPTVFSDCSRSYINQDPAVQAIIRGAVINSINASCPTCANGIDLAKANQSIPLIAQLLQANCQMVDNLDLAGEETVEYDDLWKFTMAAYHSGYSCIRDGVNITRKTDEPLDWEHVAPNISCKGAQSYVDGFWGTLLSFDFYLADTQSATSLLQVAPTFLPTPTPIVVQLPTEIPSRASVKVRVYLDANGNGVPEGIELLDGIAVELLLQNGVKLSGVTLNGEFIFDMSGYPPGVNAIVSLPGLYREKLFSLPLEGVVQVDFVFTAPEIPNQLP